MYDYVTFRSVTYGQRAERLLRDRGIRCALQRTPRWMEERGCGYCLRLRSGDLQTALRILRAEQISFRKVYAVTPGGQLEEILP